MMEIVSQVVGGCLGATTTKRTLTIAKNSDINTLRHHTAKCHSCSISQGKGLWGLAGCSLNFTMLFFM